MTFKTILEKFVSDIMNPLLIVMIGYAVIIFIWSLFEYLQGDAAKKGNALGRIGWGIFVLFVVVSIWGLVSILTTTFNGWGGSTNIRTINIPYFKSGSSGGAPSTPAPAYTPPAIPANYDFSNYRFY